MEKKKVDKFVKAQSFENFKSYKDLEKKQIIFKLKKKSENFSNSNSDNNYKKKIIKRAVDDLLNKGNDKNKFTLKDNSLAEIKRLDENKYLEYIFHRYRYEIFPLSKEIDDFPPCLQIEPSSVCNYRCIFCFETDKSFTNKKNGFMGSMKLENFKKIIDQAHNNIQFITLASRGEPLVSKNFSEMLNYTSGKFLNLKLNTNASLLNEKICHEILSDTVGTLVISADAADKDEYAKIRVNGSLDKVVKNLEMFNNIKQKHYKNSKIITRVSGVNFSKNQNFNKMLNFWNNLVDQIVFVKYNPWENSYLAAETNILEPCSDLWRRMFIWWDNKANPCDVDYKSYLSIGKFEDDLTKIWKSSNYNKLRNDHIDGMRKKIIPCKSCAVV